MAAAEDVAKTVSRRDPSAGAEQAFAHIRCVRGPLAAAECLRLTASGGPAVHTGMCNDNRRNVPAQRSIAETVEMDHVGGQAIGERPKNGSRIYEVGARRVLPLQHKVGLDQRNTSMAFQHVALTSVRLGSDAHKMNLDSSLAQRTGQCYGENPYPTDGIRRHHEAHTRS